MNTVYCNNLFAYSRWKTREIKVGELGIGDNNPIRIQSMTTTDTMNTKATVEQSIRMIDAGCELVRITAPSIKEAENLLQIKKELRKRGYHTPLVADIHFTPNAAETAARIVEKVRINPGNYVDKKKFETIDYSEASYNTELEKIREKFIPLVHVCKQYGTALRIGTNHGSLSDRILSRYGDTPVGMVESAMEFLKICEDENFYNIVLSMKASNTQVMVQAYRLLANRMMLQGMNYPLHLGVTEAGDGEDGRIKSAVGIGSLLEDGLGDTIRVSLTEEPEFEIPVAKALADRYEKRKNNSINAISSKEAITYNPFEYNKRQTCDVLNFGNQNVPRVIADFSEKEKITAASLFAVGYNYSIPNDKWNISDLACDFIYAGNNDVPFEIPGTLGIIYHFEKWKSIKNKNRSYPLFCGDEYFISKEKSDEINFVAVNTSALNTNFIQKITTEPVVLIIDSENNTTMQEQRKMIIELIKHHNHLPVIIKHTYNNISENELQLFAATDSGGLLVDGMGEGVWIKATGISSLKNINSLSFGILQATRTRISKTEYISCPSCGRTLFDLQQTTAKIRSVTNHLKGVKIGIMGCIVNGPGEMADADYGYVGTGIGKITLYKQKNVIKRNVPESDAVNELIALIKENGDWIEPNQNTK